MTRSLRWGAHSSASGVGDVFAGDGWCSRWPRRSPRSSAGFADARVSVARLGPGGTSRFVPVRKRQTTSVVDRTGWCSDSRVVQRLEPAKGMAKPPHGWCGGSAAAGGGVRTREGRHGSGPWHAPAGAEQHRGKTVWDASAPLRPPPFGTRQPLHDPVDPVSGCYEVTGWSCGRAPRGARELSNVRRGARSVPEGQTRTHGRKSPNSAVNVPAASPSSV